MKDDPNINLERANLATSETYKIGLLRRAWRWITPDRIVGMVAWGFILTFAVVIVMAVSQ